MKNVVIADPHHLRREALCSYIRHAGTGFTIDGVGDYDALRQRMDDGNVSLFLIATELQGLVREYPFPMSVGWIVGDGEDHPEATLLRGVFPRSLSSKSFLKGIESILSGRAFFPQMEYLNNQAPVKQFPREFHLSAREREVAGYLAKGASNKEIARALDLQVVTVKLHVRGVCKKLGAHNRTQAAMIAKDNNLV